MSKLLLFAGTTEGRQLAAFLNRLELPTIVCTATEYGKCVLEAGEFLDARSERLTAEEMETLFGNEKPKLVIDATHPYAVLVSENIRTACEKTDTEYLRLVRPSGLAQESQIEVASVEEAAAWLARTGKTALVTTGSKELAAFTAVPDYQEKLFARVLPTPSVVEHCTALGFTAGHLIAMQGPFSLEMNIAMLRRTKAKVLVTKESGKNGGFEEKAEAARAAGAQLLVIGRPVKETGLTLEETERYLMKRFRKTERQQVTIAGIGMGDDGNMTQEVVAAIREADVLIGAGRMLASAEVYQKPSFSAYDPVKIREFLDANPQYRKAVLLQSGDTGFFSGTKRLLQTLADREIRVLPGISSAVYLCARLQISWEDLCLVSLHGREANVTDTVRHNKKTFVLSGMAGGAAELCRKLCAYHLGTVKVTVAENLSYPEERIVTGTAEELAGQSFATLCVLLIENPAPVRRETPGMPDEVFVRGKVPMTKREARAVSMACLELAKDSVCWDVGAGTGSVSVEMALWAAEGTVYAVEQKAEGVALIRENAQKFGCSNLLAIEGKAPEALETLPAPTHVFVGGSGGHLREILQTALAKNPFVRVVINAISLETIAEATACLKELAFQEPEIICIRADRAKHLGSSQLMMGMNPIYIFAADGGEKQQNECPDKAGLS